MYKKILSAVTALTIVAGTGAFASSVSYSAVTMTASAETDYFGNEYTIGTYESLTYWKYADHIVIKDCDKSTEIVDIPYEIEGLPVTEIGYGSFGRDPATGGYFNSDLTKVTIPDSVTLIDDGAFCECINLTEITIPKSVTFIGFSAFRNCSSLTEVVILNPDCKINDLESTISNSSQYIDNRTVFYYNGVIRGYENSTAQEYAEKYGYTFESLGEYSENPQSEIGDVDGDGKIDSADATAILVEYSLIQTGQESSFTPEQLKAADIDGDGKVDSVDATIVLTYYAYVSTGGSDSLEDFLGNENPSDDEPKDPDPNENIPVPVPEISMEFLEKTSPNKSSLKFSSHLDRGYVYQMYIYRKESESYYAPYANISFDEQTTDFSYVFDFYDNGEYKVEIWTVGYSYWTGTVHIDSIGAGVVVEDPFVDDEPPVITIDVPDVTGLKSGEVFTFKVYTNEPCMINIGMDTFLNTSEVEYSAYFNDDFNIVATDSWSNSSTALVQVRAFGDGSLHNGDGFDENENPLNKDNKDSFWEDAASGKLTNYEDDN